MAIDPYAAPKAPIADARTPGSDGNFVPEGQAARGGGWSWISAGWALFAPQKGTWIGVFVLFAVIIFVLSFIPFLGAIALYVIGPILLGGIVLGADAVRRGDPLTVGHLFAGFSNNTGKLVGIGLFSLLAFIGVMVVVALIFGMSFVSLLMNSGGGNADPAAVAAMGITMLLAVLVMFALMLPIYMALWFSYPLVMFNDFAVGQALKTSFFACLKNILPFLVYGIAAMVLAVAASIPLGLGWLVLGPVLMASLYTSYRDVFYRD
jgi:uncharacterized membrane protein